MGIPSYYKKLAQTVNGFYCEAPQHVDHLLMDYNCLIYQVLRLMPPYTESARIEWEDKLIEAVCIYTQGLLDVVQAHQVYIALDGVVPLAKMKQQRMRRFRSIQLAAEERALGLRDGPSWDSNAITPGTEFMRRLAAALRLQFPSAIISDTEECGEGEHKVMRYLRTHDSGTHVIYGLDGDLFVLATLNQQLYSPATKIYFFREEADQDGKSELVWLALAKLTDALQAQSSGCETWLTEYALAMSLLGNDFVPQSMAFRIKDGGHERLIRYLQRLHGSGGRLMNNDLTLDFDSWRKLFQWLAEEEPFRIEKTIEQKRKARRSACGPTATTALKARINDRPLEWFDQADGLLWSGTMKPDWHTTYAEIGLGAPIRGAALWYNFVAARRYIEAIQWTFQYYVADDAAVQWDWMYEFSAAPLFHYVALQLPPKPFTGTTEPPTSREQLALVLPPESYWLIPKCKEREFLYRAPEYFPKQWSYFHLGKRHFWECEAHIPIPTIKGLRRLIAMGHL